MIPGMLILLGFLADGGAEAGRAGPVKAEWTAHEECAGPRRPTKGWKVAVRDAWLRTGEAPEAPTQGVLHRGQAVTLLKRARSGNILVKTEEDRKGYLRSDEVVEVTVPPLDSRPIEDCPPPGPSEWPHPPMNMLHSAEPGPEPSQADLESLEVDDPAP